MRVTDAVIAAFAMFSQIPMPRIKHSEGCMRYMMCAFALVGLTIGAALFGWCHLCMALGASRLVFSTGFVVIPVVLTGGIHLDGFCDVVDAHCSHAEPERKRTILKDPHVGAFAVIGVACYLLVFLACASEVPMSARAAVALLVIPVISRCCSGIVLFAFPNASSEGLLAMFKEAAPKRTALTVIAAELMACLIAVGLLSPALLAAFVVALAAVTIILHHVAMSEFGGMSGDLSGFYLQVCELAMVFCLALLGGMRWF